MDIRKYEIEIRRHALIRAMQRGITPDMIEATIKGGKIKRFGKNNVKFVKKYKNFEVVCVDEISGRRIKIVTVERGESMKTVKKCADCGGSMKELSDVTPEGVEYTYYRCGECGEEVLSMKQLHLVAEKYRQMKMYHAKLTRWGQSLGLRIPKELVVRYHFRDNAEVAIIPEKKGIKVVPA